MTGEMVCRMLVLEKFTLLADYLRNKKYDFKAGVHYYIFENKEDFRNMGKKIDMEKPMSIFPSDKTINCRTFTPLIISFEGFEILKAMRGDFKII